MKIAGRAYDMVFLLDGKAESGHACVGQIEGNRSLSCIDHDFEMGSVAMAPSRTKGARFDLIALPETSTQPDLILLSMFLAFPAPVGVCKWMDMQGCTEKAGQTRY